MLSSPLPCWHESLHAARTDLIVGLSPRRARIATGRPVPVGTPVFLELGRDAGIDAIAVASDADAFVVEFVTVDDAAAALIAQALQAPKPSLPRTRTDELGVPATAPVELPPFAVETPVALPATERTGEFLAADIDHAIATHDVAPAIEAPAIAPAPAPGPTLDALGTIDVPPAEAQAPPVEDTSWVDAFAVSPAVVEDIQVGEDFAAAAVVTDLPVVAPVEDAPVVVAPVEEVPVEEVPVVAAAAPSWVRSFDADLGEEPELPPTSHTQRWPTAHAASSEEGLPTTATTTATATATATTPPGWLGEVTPEPHEQAWPATTTPATTPAAPAVPPMWPTGVGVPDDDGVATARWPAARVARVSTPPLSAPPPPTTTPPTWPGEVTPAPATTTPPAASTLPVATTPPAAPAEETARWPVARVAVAPPSAPPLSFEDAEDVVLEFTAPPRPAQVSRPLPPPEEEGVVDVDFSEFRDVLGVATFKAGDARPVATTERVSTPQPVSIALPRTPSTSHTPSTPTRNPFGGDSGVGPRPDSTPPVSPDATPAAGADEQWVVSSPSLPAPRLLDRGLDRLLRSGGPNSVTPQPLPFVHDSTPSATAPAATTPAPVPPPIPLTTTPAPMATTPAPIATTTPAPIATTTTTTKTTPPAPSSAPAARAVVVPPPTPVVAPKPPPVVPVVPPRPPPVLAAPPPRPMTAVPVESTVQAAPPSRPTTAVPVESTVSAAPAAASPSTPPAAFTPAATPTAADAPPPPAFTSPPPAAPSTRPEPPPISMDEHEVVTSPGGGVQVLPLTSSAEDLPLVMGDGEDVDLLD